MEMNTHSLELKERELLTITGVTQVLRFDDSTVVVETALGNLLVQGEDLKLKKLTPDGGEVAVEGKVSAIAYEEPRISWIRRLFG